MNNTPATRALDKDMARPVTYGSVSVAMETSARTIIATYTRAIPQSRCKSTVSSVVGDLGNLLGVFL